MGTAGDDHRPADLESGNAVTEPAAPLAGDPPKVVDLKGKAVSVETTTSAQIMEFIEALRSVAAGEKHLAVGFFLVDAQGRCWTNFLMELGAALDSVGAVTLLKDRVLREYNRAQEEK